MNLFVDTSAFIALTDKSDNQHARSKAQLESLLPQDRFHTSNYVLDETITRLRFTLGASKASTFAKAILEDPSFQIHYVDPAVEREALSILRKFRDKPLSFTDCTTIALVNALGLDAVFAFDEDFSKVGLRTLPAR